MPHLQQNPPFVLQQYMKNISMNIRQQCVRHNNLTTYMYISGLRERYRLEGIQWVEKKNAKCTAIDSYSKTKIHAREC